MKAVPVLMGAALKNKGVQFLLDAIVDYLPSPLDLDPPRGHNPTTGEIETREVTTEAPATSVAYKIMHDGDANLTYLRVYSGEIRAGDTLLNATQGKRERINRLVRMHANHREDVAVIGAGDIGAAIGLRTAVTGDTLCDAAAPITLDRFVAPEPVISMAIELESDDPEIAEALRVALATLSREDPAFAVRTDPETGRTLVDGMGELHLEIIADRLRREFQLEVLCGKPQVAYRETVTKPARTTKRYAVQVGGIGQFAEVELALEPGPRGSGLSFANELPASQQLPKNFVSAVKAGVESATARGINHNAPVTDVKVALIGARQNVVDSTEHAFNIAGSMAFAEAARTAGPTLLEPIMTIELVVPDEHVGDVLGDLTARRGKITGIEARLGVQVVAGLVPLASMFGYATDLRSRTQGRASFSMQFEQYRDVPTQIANQLASQISSQRSRKN
jgi:elongation factor G